MHKSISLYKPVGMTPLEMIKQLRTQLPELSDKKISYAGRLDPMAHGVLLLLVGEETKKREYYLSLHKSYEFEVVFGIQTDTYDLLGYIKEKNIKPVPKNVNLFVNTFVNNHIGKQLQHYPPYSSKPVNGKPLFWWARNDKLSEIFIPAHEIEIFDFRCLSVSEMPLNTLNKSVKQSIASVKGDFRQESIMKRWNQLFTAMQDKTEKLQTAKFSISCSSGTYIRELVHQLGVEIGCGATAIDILRTSVGKYLLKDTMQLIP